MLQFRRRRQGRGFSCRSIPALLCKEFLTSDRLAELSKDASRYHIPFEPSHMILAQAFSSDWTIALIRTSIKSRPLAEYATEHWHGHAKFENVSSHIQDGIKSLFDNDKPHFAAWLWIGSGFSTKIMVRPCLLQSPQSPYITPHYSDFGTWRNTSSPRIQRVHPKGGFDTTQLHASAFRGHNGVFLLLIEHFPDVDVRNGWDQTPLHATSYGGSGNRETATGSWRGCGCPR